MIWIDANKEKPENAKCVLLYAPDSGVGEGAWIEQKKHFEQWRWNAVVKGVTHWAPLPEGPGGSNTEKTYEYRLVRFKPGEIEATTLNEYGDQGWLVCAISKQSDRGGMVTFVREKT